MSEITRIIARIKDGDNAATDDLFTFVYDELKRLASQRLRHERPDHSLQASALVHETYVFLAQRHGLRREGRSSFQVSTPANRLSLSIALNVSQGIESTRTTLKWTGCCRGFQPTHRKVEIPMVVVVQLKIGKRCVRMYYGLAPLLDSRRIFGITTLEIG